MSGSSCLGLSEIDYLIAFSVFLATFAFFVQYTTDYYSTLKDISDVVAVRTDAVALLAVAERGSAPLLWNNTALPERIGLQTRAYRFFVIVNNTQPFIRNQSLLPAYIDQELVSFNYSELGFRTLDVNSTVIYDENNATVAYNINGINITFRTNLSANQSKRFTVYFDDDSNFTPQSSSITGTDNLTQTITQMELFSLLQYRSVQQLNVSNYTLVRNATGLHYDFNIRLRDNANNGTVMSYGGTVPRRGTVVALERYVMYQNSTAGVRSGRITVQVW